jgi:DNA-binding NarL/FixJ family response regulator
MLRLLLVEDHAAFREALEFVLNRQPDLRVVGRCGSLAECRGLRDLDGVDLAVLDINLPDGDGSDLIGELREANPRVKVLVLSASSEPGFEDRMAGLGADAVVDKSVGPIDVANEARRLGAE